MVRALTDAEMQHYHAPFTEPASRQPMLSFPRDLPIAGEPADVAAAVQTYMEWLISSKVPKVLFWATPGILVTPDQVQRYRQTWTNLTCIDVGPGLHYLQEDHPDLIGRSIVNWARADRTL